MPYIAVFMKFLLLLTAVCAAQFAGARETPKRPEDVFAPAVVGIPPADAVSGLCKMPDGKIRHYNYGGQPENAVGGIYSHDVSHRMYIESSDGGFTWEKNQADKGEEFGPFFHPESGRYFNFLNIGGSAWFLDCGENGKCVKKSQICPWPLEFNAEPLVLGKRILMPVTLRTSSSQKSNDFVFGAIFLITDDFGKTWKKSGRLNVPHHKAGGIHKGTRWNHDAMEPSAVALKDGTLLCLLRTSLDNLWQSRSKDGGMRWEKPVPTPFYGTCVMPKIGRLSDGRLLAMWSNATSLPEVEGADGVWEDVFTNRNAIHAAISEDDGKTWRGFREVLLDRRRDAGDFADARGADKSMHQSQFIEVAPGKILAAVGQNGMHRKLVMFDAGWLLENSRECDFSNGLDDWSVFNYKKGIRGHCAYNRIAGCSLEDNPDSAGKKCMLIKYGADESLVSDIRGAVWNFPAARKGEIALKAKFNKGFKGAKIMLHDRWINPSDEVADTLALASIKLPGSLGDGSTRDLRLKFDADAKTASLFDGDRKIAETGIGRPAPIGISYLHIQSEKSKGDAGMLLLSVSEKERP